MDTPEVTSEPTSEAALVNAALGLEPREAVAPPPEPTPVEEPAFDPATIKIPSRKAVDGVPKAYEKFKDKSLTDVFTSYENAEKWGHEKSQEAAQLRRELEEERARRAAAEQVAKMTPAQEPVTQDYWQKAGINPNEQLFTEPQRVLDTTLTEAERRAAVAAEAAVRKAQQEWQAKQDEEKFASNAFATFEAAKLKLQKLGYDVSDEQWREELTYIAPVVYRTGRTLDPDAYVEHYGKLKGAPAKAQLPTEGNPPISAKSSSSTAQSVPTIGREEKALRARLADAFGFSEAEKENYIKRGGETR